MNGQVVKSSRGIFVVKTYDNKYLNLKISGKLRYQDLKPIVGDYVDFNDLMITKIYDRENFLERPKVANINVACIVISLTHPITPSYFLHKLLAIIESKNIDPLLIFTKQDKTQNLDLANEYILQNYSVIVTSIFDEQSFSNLKEKLKNKTFVFIGQSGVGKTSLINALGSTDFLINSISDHTKRGKHTTTSTQIVEFAGGKIVDTPGFSSLQFNLSKIELAHSFNDFAKLSKMCFFSRSCLHQFEKKCAVKEAVEAKKISAQRYNDYLKLLEEAK